MLQTTIHLKKRLTAISVGTLTKAENCFNLENYMKTTGLFCKDTSHKRNGPHQPIIFKILQQLNTVCKWQNFTSKTLGCLWRVQVHKLR